MGTSSKNVYMFKTPLSLQRSTQRLNTGSTFACGKSDLDTKVAKSAPTKCGAMSAPCAGTPISASKSFVNTRIIFLVPIRNAHVYTLKSPLSLQRSTQRLCTGSTFACGTMMDTKVAKSAPTSCGAMRVPCAGTTSCNSHPLVHTWIFILVPLPRIFNALGRLRLPRLRQLRQQMQRQHRRLQTSSKNVYTLKSPLSLQRSTQRLNTGSTFAWWKNDPDTKVANSAPTKCGAMSAPCAGTPISASKSLVNTRIIFLVPIRNAHVYTLKSP